MDKCGLLLLLFSFFWWLRMIGIKINLLWIMMMTILSSFRSNTTIRNNGGGGSVSRRIQMMMNGGSSSWMAHAFTMSRSRNSSTKWNHRHVTLYDSNTHNNGKMIHYFGSQQPNNHHHHSIINGSTSSSTVLWMSSSSSSSETKKKKKVVMNSDTGGLRRLPVVKSPRELLDAADKKVKRTVKADKSIKNGRNRARKEGAETLNALTQALCLPIRDVVRGYRSELRRLHPFEKVVADLTIAARRKKDGMDLQGLLQELHEARVELLNAGKDWVAASKNAPTAMEAMEQNKLGQTRLQQLFEQLAAEPLLDLISLQKELRTAPAINLQTPACVLVGAPNVGKSSIVHVISTATPEVNNYPFTTRGMTLGHIPIQWQSSTDDDSDGGKTTKAIMLDLDKVKEKDIRRQQSVMNLAFAQQLCQVMDSPGLLARTQRNEMEQLTMAAMTHLPTAVIYVMDLSGNAGDACSSIDDQFAIREEIRRRFPKRPWIDVLSKYDLYSSDTHILQRFEQHLLDTNPTNNNNNGQLPPYIKLSIHENIGVTQLQQQVLQMLTEVRIVLDAMAAIQNEQS